MTAQDLMIACHKLSTWTTDVRCSIVGESDVAVTVSLRNREGRDIARGTEIVKAAAVATSDAAAIVAKATKVAQKELKATKRAIKRERSAT